jgi:hypothetical protein
MFSAGFTFSCLSSLRPSAIAATQTAHPAAATNDKMYFLIFIVLLLSFVYSALSLHASWRRFAALA